MFNSKPIILYSFDIEQNFTSIKEAAKVLFKGSKPREKEIVDILRKHKKVDYISHPELRNLKIKYVK